MKKCERRELHNTIQYTTLTSLCTLLCGNCTRQFLNSDSSVITPKNVRPIVWLHRLRNLNILLIKSWSQYVVQVIRHSEHGMVYVTTTCDQSFAPRHVDTSPLVLKLRLLPTLLNDWQVNEVFFDDGDELVDALLLALQMLHMSHVTCHLLHRACDGQVTYSI